MCDDISFYLTNHHDIFGPQNGFDKALVVFIQRQAFEISDKEISDSDANDCNPPIDCREVVLAHL